VLCATLAPQWNISQAVYNAFVSPYSVTVALVDAGNFSIKVYPDVLAYYCFVFGLLLVGVLAVTVPSVGARLRRRFRVAHPDSVFFSPLFRLGATPGEIILIAAYVGLNAFWFWYWCVQFPPSLLDIVSTV
jgi:hypothetical protein